MSLLNPEKAHRAQRTSGARISTRPRPGPQEARGSCRCWHSLSECSAGCTAEKNRVGYSVEMKILHYSLQLCISQAPISLLVLSGEKKKKLHMLLLK